MSNPMRIVSDKDLFDQNHEDFWVFAYGSLMWKPDFEYSERQPATLTGYSRSLCIYSWVHRGTRDRPGLVFGLDRGGSCNGFAFKIPKHAQKEAVQLLRDRELVTGVYREIIGPLDLTGEKPRTVNALFYSVFHDHEQYAGILSVEEQLRLVRQGIGRSGVNVDYVMNTYDHLVAQGIEDPSLAALCDALREAL